jgi:hypothetical protein
MAFYETCWAYCWEHLADTERGGWYGVLDRSNRKVSNPDYGAGDVKARAAAPLITRHHSSLIITHHSLLIITHHRSSLIITHHSASLITRHHSASLITDHHSSLITHDRASPLAGDVKARAASPPPITTSVYRNR